MGIQMDRQDSEDTAEGWTREDVSRDGSDTVTSQGMPEHARSWKKQDRTLPWCAWRKNSPALMVILELWPPEL